MNLMEAFKALDALNEDTFSISDDGINKLAEFQDNDDLKDEVEIIDPEAETEEDLEDSYVGKVILDCTVCHSKIYKDKAEVTLDEDGTFANVGDECPYCYSADGFKVVGEVAEFGGANEESTEVNDDEEAEPVQASEEKSEEKKDVSETYDETGLKESVNNVNVETDDSIVNVSADDAGKVTVTTEPVSETEAVEGEEVIVPVTDETQAEIEAPEEGIEDVDVEIEDFDEESFDELGEGYLKEVYENVASFKTTDVSSDDTKIFVEGIVSFESGAKKKTSFIFEAKDTTKNGHVRFTGTNKELKESLNCFSLCGRIEGKKLISESFRYDYKLQDGSAVKGMRKVGSE